MADPLVSRVGPITAADGSITQNRSGKTGEQVFSQTHGKYYEASHRGVLFSAADQGAGTAITTSISTTAMFSLYNPPGSGKRLAIQKVSLGYVSGTLGSGAIYHAANTSTTVTAPSSGTTRTPTCLDIGNAATPVGVARTGSTVVAPTVLRPFCSIFKELATTANPMQQITEDVDGEIVVEPGACYQIQGVLGDTGTSPVVSVGVTWEEIPIV